MTRAESCAILDHNQTTPMKHLANLGEDGYGSRSDLYQVNFREDEIKWPEKNKETPGEYSEGETRQGKCLELRRKRLAWRKMMESGFYRPMRHSAYDCTGQIFTSGVQVIYSTDDYALIRMDRTIDC